MVNKSGEIRDWKSIEITEMFADRNKNSCFETNYQMVLELN